MALSTLGPWPLRIALALLGSVASSAQLALLLARHYPWGGGLERLYVGVFLGVGFLVAVLLWALLAPDCKRVGWRASLWLLLFTPWLLFGGAGS
ncbi:MULTISPECIES: hypothetical protein [unclassified Pseudomonas]|uniref:hypothetical protein n=1 Tax=unclassified Pseudomonas TaxID=196821 RepID=UPI0024485682|nr:MULTISPECIES: hypothetical protein [unclassified Pseudomonas]MDH0303288.1 hypothetical protein [Pseudomonas sp. GD04091]MDH1985312.1 hypothetical protein [Pseudomonas sp. GD03689]